jgi:hypothetical protein
MRDLPRLRDTEAISRDTNGPVQIPALRMSD